MKSHPLLLPLVAALSLPLSASALTDSPFQLHTPPTPDLSTLSPEVRGRVFNASPGAAVPLRPAELQPNAPLPPLPSPQYGTLPQGHEQTRDKFSADVRGYCGLRAVPHSWHATDMWGLEVELAYSFTPRQAITFSASIGRGGNDEVNVMETPEGPMAVSEDFTRTDFSAMVGYRFTQPLSARTRIAFGIKCGLDVQHLSYEDSEAARRDEGHWEYDDIDGEHEFVYDDHSYGETSCGFAYAASVMLTTQLTEHTSLLLGYQFRGATTEPDAPSVVPGGPSVSTSAMRWHEIHAGVHFVF